MISRSKLAMAAAGLLLVMLALPAAAAEVDIPDTYAGRALEGFQKAMNSGDENLWKEWLLTDQKSVDSTEVYERRFDFFQRFYKDFGGFEIARIENDAEYEVTVLAKTINPGAPFGWLMLGLDYNPEEPHDLRGISVRATDDPDDKMPEGELTDEKLAAYMDGHLQKLAANDRFSGAVLIAHNGRPIYTGVVGMACKRYDVPNKLDTKFNLGSMNKMFTGVAIAQLAQQGKLSFDDPVVKYLPEFGNKDMADKVTIHHLLTHTSGMSDYWEELFDAKFWEIKTVQQLYDLTADEPLDFEPGERFQYSNSGPIVLGLIIEKLSGLSYYDYIRENIYKPAGMINSGCFDVDRPTKNLAIGYTRMNYEGERSEEGWYNNLFMHAVKGGPAGGGYSTVEDLLAFDQALRRHTLLNEHFTDTVITGKVDMGPDMKYAYLFGDEMSDGQRIVGHNGGAPGISAVLDIYWDSGYTVAVLANYDSTAGLMASKIRRLLDKRFKTES